MASLRAKTHFLAAGNRQVVAGQLVNDSDPVVKGREHLFDAVEQATASPGERRTTKRATKRSTSTTSTTSDNGES